MFYFHILVSKIFNLVYIEFCETHNEILSYLKTIVDCSLIPILISCFIILIIQVIAKISTIPLSNLQ